jgi:hypothetical protein
MLLVMLASAWCAAGCAQQQRVSADPLGSAPSDFSLEVTILTGEQAPPSSEAHLRQSRYVLFADGSLHYGEDAERAKGGDWLPPLTRVLTRRQVAEVWSVAQHLGFTDPENAGSAAINFNLVKPPIDGVTHIAGFRAWGERWSFTQDATINQPDPAMVRLVRDLARLAWASDQPKQAVRVMPKRYDFGPDPYERYRQPGGAPAATTQGEDRNRR